MEDKKKVKYIVFDTNYLNKILDKREQYKNVLDELYNEYEFTINIGTFVEIIAQRINNQSKFEEILNLIIEYQFNIGEFKNNHCIDGRKFTMYMFKDMEKVERKECFKEIYEKYYIFHCQFISKFLKNVLYLLVILLSNKELENIEYKNYLKRNLKNFSEKFFMCYTKKSELKVKDKFNQIIYEELKKVLHMGFDIDEVLLRNILKNVDFTNIMNVFRANTKKEKEIRENVINLYYNNEIKTELNLLKNNKFEKYVYELYRKIFINCGKLNGNDITDALIIASSNINDENIIEKYIILTEDVTMQNFLKEKNEYNEEIYDKFIS